MWAKLSSLLPLSAGGNLLPGWRRRDHAARAQSRSASGSEVPAIVVGGRAPAPDPALQQAASAQRL